jgi:hypothetical protein
MIYYIVVDRNTEEILVRGHTTQLSSESNEEQLVLTNIFPPEEATHYSIDDASFYEAGEKVAYRNRITRNRLIQESDYTQLSDAIFPGTLADWQVYRQALRDITTHSNWPVLQEGDWPTKPS